MMSLSLSIRGFYDEKHTYSMLIPQQENVTKATVRNVTKDHDKELGVRLSETFWDNVFKQSHPQILVTKHGYETPISKKHLVVELGNSSLKFPATLRWQVEGKVYGQEYRIHFGLNDKNDCQGWIKVGNDYRLIELDFSDIPYKFIQELFPKLEQSLDIQISLDPLVPPTLRIHFKGAALVSATAKGYLQSPVAPVAAASQAVGSASKPSSQLASLDAVPDVQGAKGLAELGKLDDPLKKSLVHAIVNKFVTADVPSEGQIQEVTELFDEVSINDQFRILEALMIYFADRPLTDSNILYALTTILTRFQRAEFQRTFNNFSSDGSSASPVNIDRAHLVQMLTNLTTHLKKVHSQPGDVSLLLASLSATIALLDIMRLRQVVNVAEDLHKEAYNAISSFDNDSDLRVKYLANYGMQAFGPIKNDKTTGEKFIHRTTLALKGIGKIWEGIDLTAPWKIIGACFDAYPDLKEAFTFQQGEKSWFLTLFAVRRMLFEQDPKAFLNLAEGLNTKYLVVRKEMNFNNTYLVLGFVDLLLEVLRFPHFGQHDKEVKKTAVQLLREIYTQNKDRVIGIHPFALDKAQESEKLFALVAGYLYSCTTHTLPEVCEAANEAIKAAKIQAPSTIAPFTVPLASSELYDEALKKDVPLLGAMQRIKKELQTDLVLVKEKPYFIELDARDEKGSLTEPLETKIRGFLKGKSIVLTLHGEGGAGKSLGIKIFAERLLQEYNQAGYFPIYLYLPAFLKDPYHDNLEAFIRDSGIDAYEEAQLKMRKVVFIMDAYDEVNFTALKGRDQNIYQNNTFSKWPNAKVIFLYRTGVGERERFNPSQGTMESFVLCPFNERKIFDYVERYVNVREEAHRKNPKVHPLPWTLEQYTKVFKIIQESSSSKLWSVITNPFRLKVLLEVFPLIADRHQKKSQRDLKDLFKGQDEKAISDELFETYACVLAFRASEKQGGAKTPQDFLEYSIQFALKMDKLGLSTIPWPVKIRDKDSADVQKTNREISEEFKELLDPSRESLYSQCLIRRDSGWEFMHRDYYLHLTTAIDDDVHDRILHAVSEEEYKRIFGSAPLAEDEQKH